MFKKRNRFFSEQCLLIPQDSSVEIENPPSPVIHNLVLEPAEELEDLEIAPSDEYEAQEQELSIYLSSTNDEPKMKPPKAYTNTQFNINIKHKEDSKRRTQSHCQSSNKMSIFEALNHKE